MTEPVDPLYLYIACALGLQFAAYILAEQLKLVLPFIIAGFAGLFAMVFIAYDNFINYGGDPVIARAVFLYDCLIYVGAPLIVNILLLLLLDATVVKVRKEWPYWSYSFKQRRNKETQQVPQERRLPQHANH